MHLYHLIARELINSIIPSPITHTATYIQYCTVQLQHLNAMNCCPPLPTSFQFQPRLDPWYELSHRWDEGANHCGEPFFVSLCLFAKGDNSPHANTLGFPVQLEWRLRRAVPWTTFWDVTHGWPINHACSSWSTYTFNTVWKNRPPPTPDCATVAAWFGNFHISEGRAFVPHMLLCSASEECWKEPTAGSQFRPQLGALKTIHHSRGLHLTAPPLRFQF